MADNKEDKDKEKNRYTVLSIIGIGGLSYLITKDKTISLIGASVSGYYTYNNFEDIKKQIDDIENTNDTENNNSSQNGTNSILDYISPPVIIGNFIRSIF